MREGLICVRFARYRSGADASCGRPADVGQAREESSFSSEESSFSSEEFSFSSEEALKNLHFLWKKH